MFLKKIYVHGFKSFADKTEIVVEKGMTAIVGPNGSGKSNISDSIKWVLGEQSPKTLRGTKMEDIIFAGTQKRMPLGYADVELVFDNQSRMLPIEYNEVSIKRRLFRTGESEYSINKQPCRLKDIRELFMDTGIGKDGYSVIGQGKVEEILSPNSDVRRGVFEEAAGIVKFKVRKEEAIKKLDKTNDNLDRVKDIIYELETRVEPLKVESEKAQEYINLKDNLKNIELNLYVREYEKNKEQLLIFENQKSDVLISKQDIISRRDKLEKIISEEKENLISLDKEILSLEGTKNSLSKNYDEKNNLIKVQNEKIFLYSENIESIENEIEILKKRKDELLQRVEDHNNEISSLSFSLADKKIEYDNLNEEALAFKIKMESSINSSEEKRTSLFEKHKLINKLQSDRNSTESIIANFQERIEQFDKEIEIETNEKIAKLNDLDIVKNEQISNAKMLENLQKNYNSNITKQENFIEDKKEMEIRLRSSLNEFNTANSRIAFLNNMESLYEGYYKSVQTLMSLYKKEGLFKASINGTVADLIKTDKKYETAIEIALGSAIQNVIVNNNQDAESIIEYLKEKQIGRVTFLPISTIKGRGLNNDELNLLVQHGVIDTADNLIEADDMYSNIIKSLLGRTIIVENIRDGFRVAKLSNNTLKIVSIQGDVINPGGAVTGGYISGKNQNILSRKREIEESQEKLVSLSRKCKDIEDDIKNIDKDLASCHKEINALKINIEEVSKISMQADNRINLLTEQIAKIDISITRYIKDKTFIFEENIKRNAEIETIDKNIDAIKLSIVDLENEINDIAHTNKADKEKYDEISLVLSAKNNELASISQEIKFIEDKIKNTKLELEKNDEMLELKTSSLSNTDTEIESAKLQISVLQSECDELKRSLDESEENYNSKKLVLSKTQDLINDSQVELNNINKKITEILDDEYAINIKIEKINSKIDEISNRLWEDYEMNYAMALPYKNEEISYSRVNNDVSDIRKKLKSLGDVNINAIKEYKEVKDRYDFLTKQKQDLIDARNQLNDVIKELELKMRDQFVEEFAKIRLVFNEVFSDLFNGGKADVYLEDESDALNSAIEIEAQPPGKKLSKITLLSGGEKALTAIALLFSILKTKPTSFCILDEIEAALDDINVYRFSRYLKEFSKQTQFLCITHRKGTMESADTLYGTTMEEKGVTKLVSMRLSELE